MLRSGIVVRGGYAGCGAPDPDERDFVAHPSILSADLNQDDGPLGSGTATDNERAENCYHVVTSNETDADSVLDGFTIYGGNADGGATFDSGGGMRNTHEGDPDPNDGEPAISNCTFYQNYALSGGGMLNQDVDPIVTNCVFRENIADVHGGGMENTGAKPVFLRLAVVGSVRVC